MRHLKPLSASILIVSALLLSGGSDVSGSDEKHQNQTTTHEHGGNNKPQVATPSFTIVVQPAPVQIIQPSTPVEKNKPKQKWYERPTITDWGILGVTLLYVLISLGLLNETRKQAALAKTSADLARGTLLAMARPKLVVRYVRKIVCHPDKPIEVTYTVVNIGGWPAYVIESNFVVSDSNSLPPMPPYKDGQILGKVVIPSGAWKNGICVSKELFEQGQVRSSL
jgi:hypothetical protein